MLAWGWSNEVDAKVKELETVLKEAEREVEEKGVADQRTVRLFTTDHVVVGALRQRLYRAEKDDRQRDDHPVSTFTTDMS